MIRRIAANRRWRIAVPMGLVAGCAAGIVVPAVSASDDDPTIRARISTGDDSLGRPVQVGDVIGRARLQDGVCVIEEPIGLQVQFPDGRPGVASWQFNEDCVAVVTDIRPATEAELDREEETNPPGGTVERPRNSNAERGD